MLVARRCRLARNFAPCFEGRALLGRRYLGTSRVTLTEAGTKPYYVTTPIYYVNAAPHIGHLYSSVMADVAARYARLRYPNRPVEFCTGTDEHGMKIQKAAQDNGQEPREFCDRISQRFRDLAEAADISHTRFIRTTDADHYEAVHHLWGELQKRGHIYKGAHSGWYSVSDETFYGESQTEDVVDEKTGETVKVSKETGSRVEWTSEENYKFRLSTFREKLIEWLQNTPNAIIPSSRHEEVLQSLMPENSLEDLSISRPRSRLTWGIPVPGDPDHTIYVWVDALTNYITAAGYPKNLSSSAWPADLQVIGKDIVRFHTIYWPAILFALDIPPPKSVLAHAHWTMSRSKMSKSRGNVVDPHEVMKTYGIDAVRYYLMRIGGVANDADWSNEQLLKHYSRDLAGVLGNFASRIQSPKIQAKIPNAYDIPLSDAKYISPSHENHDSVIHTMIYGDGASTRSILRNFEERMENFEYNRATELVMDMVTEANRNFQQAAIWASDTTTERLIRTHFYSTLALHVAGVLLRPFMPTKSLELLDLLNVPHQERTWAYLEGEIGSSGGARKTKSSLRAVEKGVKPAVLFPPVEVPSAK